MILAVKPPTRSTRELEDASGPADVRPEFVEIYRRYAPFVWSVLSRYGVPAATRDDALQEVFVTVHRKLWTYDKSLPMTPWLAGIARRVASRFARTEQRSRRRALAADAPPAPIQPDARLSQAQAVAFMEAFLQTLPDSHRDIFTLSLEGWSAPEIATALDLKLGTVYSRLHAARQRMGEAVARWEGRADVKVKEDASDDE